MLSIVDLIEAGTLTVDLAAYLLAAISGGASFMVGALPGGAGKTTVMGALLNLVPACVELTAADGSEAIAEGISRPSPRRCFICHEIGPGGYYAYLWGRELREYFSLPSAGHMLATNLHADTYEQARDQICGDNHVPESNLRQMHLMLFLSMRPGGRRRIEQVWETDGQHPHVPVFSAAAPPPESLLVPPSALATARETIQKLLASGVRTIQEVRAHLVQWRAT